MMELKLIKKVLDVFKRYKDELEKIKDKIASIDLAYSNLQIAFILTFEDEESRKMMSEFIESFIKDLSSIGVESADKDNQ
jgi:hypothetical protein